MIEQTRVAEHEVPPPDFYVGQRVKINWAVLVGEVCRVVKSRSTDGDWFPQVWLTCVAWPGSIWGSFSARGLELLDVSKLAEGRAWPMSQST